MRSSSASLVHSHFLSKRKCQTRKRIGAQLCELTVALCHTGPNVIVRSTVKERERRRRAEGSHVQSLKKWTEHHNDSVATLKFLVGTWRFLVGKTAFLDKKRPRLSRKCAVFFLCARGAFKNTASNSSVLISFLFGTFCFLFLILNFSIIHSCVVLLLYSFLCLLSYVLFLV